MNDTLTLEALVALTAIEVGHGFDDPEGTDAYAIGTFVSEVVEAAGTDPSEESVVRALTATILNDPVMFRFFVVRFKEASIIHNRPIEGGILDQKLAEAEALIGAIWRYVP